jgi:excisionase family DNA binding protein
MQDLLTADDVAQMLGLTTKNVHQLVRTGELGHVQITPRKRRFTREQVDQFIQNRSVPTPTPVDKTPRDSLPCTRREVTKSVRDSGTSLAQEIRDLCQ